MAKAKTTKPLKLTKFKLDQLIQNCAINKRIPIKISTPLMDKFIGKLNRKPLFSTSRHIKFYKDINCLKGNMHKRSLPVRGQRTHTNAKTAKKHTNKKNTKSK